MTTRLMGWRDNILNILVTGSAGFVGRNLVENLKNIREGKNRTRLNIHIENIYEYDINSTPEQKSNKPLGKIQ